MNCYQRSVQEIKRRGGKLISGQATNPKDNKEWAHCWVLRDDAIVDTSNWYNHHGGIELYMPGTPEFAADNVIDMPKELH